MELRKYQEDALSELESYIKDLATAKDKLSITNEALIQAGHPPEKTPVTEQAWQDHTGKTGYHTLINQIGDDVPNVCFRVPTGGGKTLLSAHAVGIINQHYLKRHNGLVLWIVPSEAIYSQTKRSFMDYDHPYRAILDLAAKQRRANILEKHHNFSQQDVSNNLSIMLLMLQSSRRQSKDFLKIFQDSGQLMDFFPPTDDYPKQTQALHQTPNLDHHGTGKQVTIKTSLVNVIRQARPIIVLDESHNSNSDLSKDTIKELNPSFVLELSATPQKSNILVDVPGTTLRDQEMIKLPIQLTNTSDTDWKATLAQAKECLDELTEKAKENQQETAQYIRPIMLVRVEATGANQVGKGKIHTEDARKHLTTKLGFKDNEVCVKVSGRNEIHNVDLMKEGCPVRVIITKDALKEGWDCPFAYVLALLDTGTSSTALTQMIGRVLRQPTARATKKEELNCAYVFTYNQNVNEAVEKIKIGLQNEGLGDLGGEVFKNSSWKKPNKKKVLRQTQYRDQSYCFPKVSYKEGRSFRPLSYERDILSNINWEKMQYTWSDDDPSNIEKEQRKSKVFIDLNSNENTNTESVSEYGNINYSYFVNLLIDVLPNPWCAMLFCKDALAIFDQKQGANWIYQNRIAIAERIKKALAGEKERLAKTVFDKNIEQGTITFNLDATQSPWKIPREIYRNQNSTELQKDDGDQLALGLFERYEEKDFNKFEEKVACYLDEKSALDWWHRVAVKSDGLQGWRKHMVYPDFIALVSKNGERIILETKGDHLKGNDDTEYKKKLFERLENTQKGVGTAQVQAGKQTVRLGIVFQNKDHGSTTDFKSEIDKLISK